MAKAKKAAASRRSSKASKDEEVETKAGVQLLLANLPSDRDATHHYENILGWMAKVKSAQGKLGDAKKKAKEAGIDVAAITTVMRMERADPLDVAAQLKEQQRLMRLRGLPIQMGLYEAAYKSVEDQAYAIGFADGKNGRSMNETLYPEGSAGFVAYSEGWDAGQKEIIMGGADE